MSLTRVVLKTASSVIAASLAAIIAVQTTLLPAAQANVRCEALFIPRELPEETQLYNFTARELAPDATLQSALPEDLQQLFSGLKPKTVKKFEKRFLKRDRIAAEDEASRIMRVLLSDENVTETKFFTGRTTKQRREALTNVLHARLSHVSADIRLEKLLLEIGYGEGSKLSHKWSDFRAKHFRRLNFFMRTAINMATTYAMGIPLGNVKPYQNYRDFRPVRAQRHYWHLLEPTIRNRIKSQDPGQLRELRIELALKFVTRLLAAVVFLMIMDEILERLSPDWHVFKLMHGAGAIIETRERLERQAFENWKDLVESFTGERPADDSPEAQEILDRIDATSKSELWLHIHEGGPLKEPPQSLKPQSERPLSSVPQQSRPKRPLREPPPEEDSQTEQVHDPAI